MKLTVHLLWLCPLTFGIGIAMTFQTVINSALREHLESALHAALISFSVGTLTLLLLVLFFTKSFPQWQTLSLLPWYLWFGGCLGVYAISMSIYTAPKLGFLTFSGLVLFGQISMSILLDHFAWFGNERVPISWQRVCGAVAIFVGVLLTLQR